jgi:hypothetical protein
MLYLQFLLPESCVWHGLGHSYSEVVWVEDNIKMDLENTGWEGLNRIHLPLDRAKCIHGIKISRSIKSWEFYARWETISFLKRILPNKTGLFIGKSVVSTKYTKTVKRLTAKRKN